MLQTDRMVAPVDTIVSGPQPPNITKDDIWAQFKIDIAGKEVQTAESYSHSWIANQFGHVCLGILLGGALGIVLGSGLSVLLPWLRLPFAFHIQFPWDTIAGSVIAVISIAVWEWRAYRTSIRNATGQFPVDRKLLRDNALVAAAYMVLGAAIAFVYRIFAFTPSEWLGVPNLVWGLLCFLGLVIIGVVLAVPWLRQKIVWQKAGLPYLFRLAEAQPTMEDEDAKQLQSLITSPAPPDRAPYQIVIGGPIGSGRTQLSAGIGTELAFKPITVRYLTFTTLLEFAARSRNPYFSDDSGPANITYWSWSTAQAVIIDDIGPLLGSKAQAYDELVRQFRQILSEQLGTVRSVLKRCHTVWVIGDPRGDGQIAYDDQALDQFALAIREYCRPDNPENNLKHNAEQEVLVAQLDHGKPAQIPKPRVRTRKINA